MKKIVLLAMLLTVGLSFGQNSFLVKQFEIAKKDYSITDENKILYKRVIDTKYNAKENYDNLLEVLVDKTPNTIFKNILPNSDMTKITFDGETSSFKDTGYNIVRNTFKAVVIIKDKKLMLNIYPTKYIVNSVYTRKTIVEEYPFGEKDKELKKVRKKNPKLSRFIESNHKITEYMWRIDDLLSGQKDIVF